MWHCSEKELITHVMSHVMKKIPNLLFGQKHSEKSIVHIKNEQSIKMFFVVCHVFMLKTVFYFTLFDE